MARTRKVSKQKKRNTWYLVYRPPGSAKQMWEPVGNDEEIAELRRLEKIAQIANPDYIEPSRDSFTSVAEEWWSRVATGLYAESTLVDYRSILDCHLIPAFGTKPVSKIRYREIQHFASDKQGTISNKRIRNLLNVLSDVFKYAVKAEMCRDNPVDKVERPPVRRQETDFLEPEELWRLFEAVKEVQPFYAPLVIAAVMTGMRLGELRSLTWSNVDFKRNEIRVRSSQSRTTVKDPKTGAGWRTVPMSTLVREQLVECHAAKIEGCDLVFPSHRLTPFDPGNVRKRVLYKALDHAKLRRVKWHSLRHSAASLMAHSNASEKEVQAILGHSSIQVTKDLYTHLFTNAKSDAIARMDELMCSTKPEEVEEAKAVYGDLHTLSAGPEMLSEEAA
jgi:integrase